MRLLAGANRGSVFFFTRSKVLKKTAISFEGRIHSNPSEEHLVLKRAIENPILRPKLKNGWESDAVFNAGAIYLDGKVHFIYRAVGESGLSVFGYASSGDGIHIDERSTVPAFVSDKIITEKENFFIPYPYISGGSWWGSEDPRLTRIGQTIYMTYTGFDGVHPPCVALTSIDVDSFLKMNWNWKKPVLISSPWQVNKNWVIFPEKVNGKYAILHSITPEISIAYEERLDFDDKSFIDSHYRSKGREEFWDNWVRGAGPPPIRTSEGWLVLYHAMDKKDPDRYKVGAMLLDLRNPEKVLHRSRYPLLEPDCWYENNGHKSGVVYACGAAVIGATLYVYYGGADTFVCAASVNLKELLTQLKKDKSMKMRPFHSINDIKRWEFLNVLRKIRLSSRIKARPGKRVQPSTLP